MDFHDHLIQVAQLPHPNKAIVEACRRRIKNHPHLWKEVFKLGERASVLHLKGTANHHNDMTSPPFLEPDPGMLAVAIDLMSLLAPLCKPNPSAYASHSDPSWPSARFVLHVYLSALWSLRPKNFLSILFEHFKGHGLDCQLRLSPAKELWGWSSQGPLCSSGEPEELQVRILSPFLNKIQTVTIRHPLLGHTEVEGVCPPLPSMDWVLGYYP